VNQKLSNSQDEAARPVPLGIAAVLLFSDEPEALAEFYREVLGVPLRRIRVPDADTHWACDIKGVYFSIWPETEVTTNNSEWHRGGVAFHFKNVDREFERLKALGIKVDFPPRNSVLGRIARLRDPDGNPFEIYQPVPGKTESELRKNGSG
jgi:glyoxylase I family protein